MKKLTKKILKNDNFNNKKWLLNFINVEKIHDCLKHYIENDDGFESKKDSCNWWLYSETGLKAMNEEFSQIIEVVEKELLKKYGGI
tara:strand:- start:363 stop:620 length:258 start_codon:yes stop_codon:yes gene_type:complete